MIRSMSNAASTLDVAAPDALASGSLTKEPNVSLPEHPSTVRGFFFAGFAAGLGIAAFTAGSALLPEFAGAGAVAAAVAPSVLQSVCVCVCVYQ